MGYLNCDHDLGVTFGGPRPEIVVLCGSTRFGTAFRDANLRETVAGKIVLSIGCDSRSDHELWADLNPAEIHALTAQLDETVQQLVPAVVVEGSYDGDTCRVRVFGPPGFMEFAIANQGYGEIVGSILVAAADGGEYTP